MIWQLIINYWKKQTRKEKFLILLVLCGFAYGFYFSVKYSYSEYQRLKGVETEYNLLLEQKEEHNQKIDNTIKKGTAITKRAKKKNIEIDKKLKEDEATIDNTNATDDYLKRYIAEHQKR